MSSPRKEYFLGRWNARLDVPFSMGVGGAVDVIAGVTRRAPAPLQRIGLEWAFRLVQEPRRLAKRYVVTNSVFVRLILRDWMRWRAHRRRATGTPHGSSVSTVADTDRAARRTPV
jgi:N-acetylglucosaminyldiphosphoundecaprenol N-acetyl-beta-D-mannosaminyltransferase